MKKKKPTRRAEFNIESSASEHGHSRTIKKKCRALSLEFIWSCEFVCWIIIPNFTAFLHFPKSFAAAVGARTFVICG